MAEATIDELQIEISSDSDAAAQSIENFAQSLSKLIAPVQTLTSGGGLSKLAKQLEKISALTAAISNLSGFEKIAQATNALKTLDSLTGTPNVSAYVKALNKLSQVNSAVQAIAWFPDISNQITSLTTALNGLRGVQDINITSLTNSLSKLPAIVQAINAMPAIDSAKMQSISEAIKPLTEVNAKQINSFVRAMNKLPEAAKKLNQIDFSQFTSDINQFVTALDPLIQRVQNAADGLSSLAQVLQYTRSSASGSNGLGGLSGTLGNLSTKSLVSWGALIKLKNALTDCFEVSAQYVENLNLFNVTMGKTAQTAFGFAEKVNDALGIDTSDWIRYQGFFQSIGKGFGVVTEKADLMSQNLTQLAYDISSFYNASTEEAYNKVQSGFAGELEPLRRFGFALDEATLKQLAYKKGITQTYESMTQAQKAQLRYVAMIEQAQNIGVTGDMSRTIDTASNGVRVLEARIRQFCRAIGNMVMPILSAVLPYFTAFVQVITDAANAIANAFGFELPKIELGGISNGYDDIATAADDATAATEKFKGSLASVDQLNIIGSHKSTSGAGTDYSTDLNISLPTYDFLNGVESKTKEIAENLKTWFKEALPWVEAVAIAIASVFAVSQIIAFKSQIGKVFEKLMSFNDFLKNNAKNFWGVAGGIAAGAASGVLFYNSLKNLIKGTGNLSNNILQLTGAVIIAVGAIGGFIACGNPVGAVITGVLAGIGLLAGAIVGINDNIEENNRRITNSILYKNGGTKISDIAKATEDWANAAAQVNQETISKYNQLDTYTQQIDDLLGEMDKFATSDFDMTKLTAADATELKEPFVQLCDYLNGDFLKRAQTAADDLRDVFKNLGLSGVISEQVMQGYEKMKKTFDENLTASQTKVSEYLDRIAAGETLSDGQYAEFMKEYNYILETARNADKNFQALDKAVTNFETLDLSKIDLESPDTVISALEQINNAATNYSVAAAEKYEEEIDNLRVLARQAQTELDAGKIKQNEYDEQIGLIDLSRAFFAQDYANNIAELESRVGKVYSNIQDKYSKASRAVNPTLYDAYMTVGGTPLLERIFNFDNMLDEARQVASGNWLNNNEGYQTLLSGMDDLRNITSNVDINVNAPKEGTSAYKWYKAATESGILTVDVAANIHAQYDEANKESSVAQPTGYAREALKESYITATRGQSASVPASSGDTTFVINIDGDEFVNYIVGRSNEAVMMKNGR